MKISIKNNSFASSYPYSLNWHVHLQIYSIMQYLQRYSNFKLLAIAFIFTPTNPLKWEFGTLFQLQTWFHFKDELQIAQIALHTDLEQYWTCFSPLTRVLRQCQLLLIGHSARRLYSKLCTTFIEFIMLKFCTIFHLLVEKWFCWLLWFENYRDFIKSKL